MREPKVVISLLSLVELAARAAEYDYFIRLSAGKWEIHGVPKGHAPEGTGWRACRDTSAEDLARMESELCFRHNIRPIAWG